jgi:TonB family protein
MNPQLVWDNLVAYSLQIGLLVGLAAFIPTALRLRLPATRLAYWHLLLAACLLLPALRPWKQVALTLSTFVPAAVTARVPPRPDPALALSPAAIALILLAVGMLVRTAWLVTGFWRLARLRRHSRPLLPVSSWSVEADLRISDAVSSPVTFGFLHPAVLLPANFTELEASAQDAILCHEILHVRRRDWLFTLAEELVRGIFWFHPAIWWLLGEIGLAREQVVDRQVVALTRSRDEYLDALLVIAGAKPRLDLAPAPLFLRKRHLKQRVVSLMKEVRMSKTRSISSLAAGLGILALACWFVTATFPLAAAPQLIADGPGVTVDTGGAVMHRTAIAYPESARAKGITGVVTVEATVDGSGNVVDTRVLNGPNELRRAAQQSVLSWHFAVDGSLNTRMVKVNFDLPAESSTSAAPSAAQSSPVPSQPHGQTAIVRLAPPSLEGKRLGRIFTGGMTDSVRNRLLSRLPIHEGDILTADSLERLRASVREFDEHINVGNTSVTPDGQVGLTFTIPGVYASSDAFGGLTSAIPAPKRININGDVQQAKLVSQPRPVYPPLAKQAHISGVVHLQAVIGKEGNVINLAAISGHPLLVSSAMEAVQQWVYQPTLLNGEPVEVSTQIDVNYTLADRPPLQQ